jgi:hypothetical protein
MDFSRELLCSWQSPYPGPQRPCSWEAARDSFVPYSFLLLRSGAMPIHRIYCCCGPFAFAITVLIDFLITQSSGIMFKGPLLYLTFSGVLLPQNSGNQLCIARLARCAYIAVREFDHNLSRHISCGFSLMDRQISDNSSSFLWGCAS